MIHDIYSLTCNSGVQKLQLVNKRKAPVTLLNADHFINALTGRFSSNFYLDRIDILLTQVH